jgi:hypothetical protein
MRKIGVGFNQPLVIEGRCQFEWQRRWDLCRRLQRLRKSNNWLRMPNRLWGISVVETHRVMYDELKPRKGKRKCVS